MDILTITSAVGLLIVAGVILILACTGAIIIAASAWKAFAQWAGRNSVAEERCRAKRRLAQQKRIAKQCEQAILLGASTVASQLVQTVVATHLQHLSHMEAARHERIMDLLRVATRDHASATVPDAALMAPARQATIAFESPQGGSLSRRVPRFLRRWFTSATRTERANCGERSG